MYQNDTPKQIARTFCERNNLDPKIEGKIVNYIERNIPTLSSPDTSSHKTLSPPTKSKATTKSALKKPRHSYTRNQQGETESLKECIEGLADRILGTAGTAAAAGTAKRYQAGDFGKTTDFNLTYNSFSIIFWLLLPSTKKLYGERKTSDRVQL